MEKIYKREKGNSSPKNLFSKVAISTILLLFSAFASFGQNVVYQCDFEDADENANWTFANCDYYNGWYIGTAAYNGGSKGLYISNDYGTSNLADYDDTYVYAYREINATETDQYLIVFDWMAVGATPDENSGEGYCLLRSFLVPTTLSSNLNECDNNGMSYDNNTTPSGWIDVSSSENGLMYGKSSWQHSAKVINLDAGTYYLVFFWKNNSDNIDPPAAVDNISITKVVNPAVATSAVSNLGATFATLNGEILSHGASDVIARGFEYGTDSENLSNTLQSADNTDAFSSELTGLAPNTTYYYRAYATNSNGTGYGAVKSFKTLDTFNGHAYVDLGLESGTLWATTNVGANSPEEYGNYFAWGETSPKETYSWSNYAYCNGESNSLTKYCGDASYGYNGYTDDFYYLESTDDAATANWGTGWQMPTYDELEELNDYCTVTWTTRNGVNGRLYTGPNGNSIFLPAAGDRDNDNLESAGSVGCYWSSSRQYAYNAWYLNFYSGNSGCDYDSRHYGYSVRPVLKAIPTVETKSATDVEPTTAILQGKILFTEDATVTNRGFSFGTDSDDLTQDFISTDNTDNFTYSVTDLTANTTYYFKAYATINGDIMYGEIKSFTTPRETHDFVDLGLPSGNKWATCNVGASVPEGFGNYYGWGETYNKEIGDWPTYIYYNGSSFTKYTRSDGRTTLEAMDDAATVNWGDGWRMPTKDEVSELFNNCSSIWTTLNGVNGRLFTSNLNGNTIFLPAAGKVNEGGYENDGRSGTYWASSFRTTSTNEGAWDYEVYPDVCELGSLGYRKYGRSVRAVYTLAPTVVTNNATYLTSTSATLNASITDNGNSEIIERGFKYGTDRNNLSEIVQSNDATSDFSVTITGLAPNTTYYYVAYATNSDATDYAGIKSFSTNGIIDGHEYVDLGLPSGTKWAACNIGTDVPYDLGDYFAWGETTSKDVANWDTYIYYDNGSITKYTDSDGLTTLEATDDAATVNWGSNWRMPTKEEMEEMLNNCDNVWTTWNGVEGRLFTSHINGNSFFMPAAGKQDGSEIFPDGGHYWSSTLRPNDTEGAWDFYFSSSSCNLGASGARLFGYSVRAINRRSPSVVTNTADNITSTAATLHGNISNIGASEIIESGFEYGINRENLNESVQCTDGTNDFSVSLSNLASGTTYYYRAYATNSDDTGYGEIKYFSTPCDNLCSIIYSFTDDYGDGWNGNAINVVEVGTGIVIESLTLDNGSVASGTVEICDGKDIIFEWVEGYYSEETSYQIFDVNGDEIFSDSGTMSSPVSYTMSCSSCRAVADFTISDITTESATISWTERGQATSWELIVSETELDNNALESYNNTITLAEPSYSATGLTIGTQYYVYVRSVCSDNDKSGWKKRIFRTVCSPDNMCNIIYSLSDDYGDGWTGNAINVVEAGTGTVIESLTIDNGSSATGTLEICDGREIIFEWVSGGNYSYPEETSYQILDANEDVIFSGTNALLESIPYTMSCPSCRMVTDFAIAGITTESATISFTGHVTATSWELIVSETELDDADLESYNNAIILTEPSYSVTGLTFATQYYVYVRSVCSGDDKSRWKIGAFNTAICAPEDMCGISYELASEISIGWSGGAINIVDVESEIAIATLTIDQGYSATGIVDVCDGKEIRIDYTAGRYPDFVSYNIFDANGDVIDSYYGLDSPTSHSQLYTVSCPTCRPVKNIRATEITTESATIRWADYGSAESWEIIVSDEEIDNNALDGNDAIVQSADSSFVATGLTSSTNYYVYVHALCLGNYESQWRSYSFTTTQIPATIPYTCDFEDTDENTNWVLANGNQTNQWHIGEAASNGGENGLYISNDDGVSNEYDINSTSVVYAYRTIDIEENAIYTISFDWKSNGNGSNYSAILGVFLAPASSDFDLSGGNDLNYLTYDWIYLTENPLADATSWQNFTKIINIDEGSYNLIFYWINRDGGGENPPAAIDNISIKVNEVATIPYTCDFEDADENANWILANGDQTNQWHIGEAANNGGENGLYISNDDGVSNEYDINSTSFVYADRAINIDENDIYEISFDWRLSGDEHSAYLGVYLVPTSSYFDLSGEIDLDDAFPDDWIIITEEPLAGADSWQNLSKIINIDEGIYNLIFYWANYDGGDGENPPATIDNISINSLTPDISVTYPMDRSTTEADITINYSPFTDDENYTLLLHYGTNRNIIYQIVYADYESTNEYFYAEITNLQPDTKYYYYAEARSEFGTFQSDTLWFYTYDSFIDDRDNHQYYSIRIGNQIWMAEDLDYAGDIPQGTTETSLTEPYRYRASYCTEYWTYQYNWPAAMNLASSSNENPSGVQGVCPNGWHLPSEAEWQELYDTLGGSDRDAGSQLVSGIYSDGKTIAESRYFAASGFDAIYSGGYDTNYENATFWSATASNTDEAYYHRIYSGSTDLLSGSIGKDYGFNVRCVKGSSYYVYDTLPYCGTQYEYHDTIITASGDYTIRRQIDSDTDSIYKLHITFFEIPVATISDFSNGCFGQNNGHATVSVEGGTAPYNYAWNIPEAQNSATLGNLAGGEYIVIVTDANGCSATSSVEITTPDEIAVSIADTACNSYEWNGTTYTETGEYTQTLQTSEGCDSVVTLRLTINHSSTGEFTDLMCAGVPYTYGGETFNEAGTYEVTLTNSVGCDSVVTLTLTYADDCNGIVSGIITDAATGEAIPNARVIIGNVIARTNTDGEYSLSILRGRWLMRVSATGYASYSETIDVQGDIEHNIELYMPRIAMDVDSISVTTYPYLAHNDSITITNIGNTPLVWSSLTDYENLELLPEQEETHRDRNSRAVWDSIQTFTTQFNAEQAISTDGFFIYTSSWMRPGEFNRYTPNGEYIETFFIENVGMIRNLSFDGTYFYGTEASNIIFKLDLNNQMIVDSILTDISTIRHCSFDRQNGNLLAGDWNSLYSIDTATGVSTPIRNDLMNVYSSTFDNLSPGGPYLWLFSQTSQDNGPSAYIRQFSISNGDYTDNNHYLDDIEIGDASLAGGICASEYIVNGKFVLLANVQNPSGNNTIATYEIGRTNNIVSTDRRCGELQPNESIKVAVSEYVTETGDYNAAIRYRIAVMGSQSNNVPIAISSISPECDAVQQITMVTDTFSTVTLNWQPVELGEYNSVSYLVFSDNSQFAIDTTAETSITFDGLSVGEHCYSVRALSVGEYTCMSESSDTVCAEIQNPPCDIYIMVESESDGDAIYVEWNKPTDVEYFRISRDDGAVDEILYEDSFIDSNVIPETDYCYTLTGYLDNSLCNEVTSTTCMRIVSGVCTEAPELKVETIGSSVVLSWTRTSDSYSFKIFKNDEPIRTTTDTTYYDKSDDSGNYCYKVKSICEYRMFAFSNEECVDVDGITEWNEDKLSLYPNPTYGQFFIEGSHIAIIWIFNASGQLVTEIDNNKTNRIEINCEGWNPGLYNVQMISTEGMVATKKLTIFK